MIEQGRCESESATNQGTGHQHFRTNRDTPPHPSGFGEACEASQRPSSPQPSEKRRASASKESESSGAPPRHTSALWDALRQLRLPKPP
jgi:hypothetical protein